MPEKVLIENCSPTLAGLKTANLVNLHYDDPQKAREDLRQMNRVFVKKGLRAIPLRYRGSSVLVYIYRPARLKEDIARPDARKLLSDMGYPTCDPASCLSQLSRRLKDSSSFPHEIGLFLGYPTEDVEGFIYHKDEGCKCTGYWKVYGDVDAAQRRFAQYKKCTQPYCRLWHEGKSMERLTVAV